MKKIFLLLIIISAYSCKKDDTVLEQESAFKEDVVVENTVTEVEGYNSQNVSVKGVTSLILTGPANAVLQNSKINLCGNESWLYLPNINIKQFYEANLINNILIDSKPSVILKNVSIERYYNGVYLKAISDESYIPMYAYKDGDETQYPIELNKVYSSDDIPVGDDALKSIMLKRGHMAVLAENEDGTGERKLYVAADSHLEINVPDNLKGKVSFIRVVSWTYPTKKGIGSNLERRVDFNVSWYYNWGTGGTSSIAGEFVPMFWGGSLATLQPKIDDVLQYKNVNHTLTFNEPDSETQSNLDEDVAAERYGLLLKTGLRMGSPACTEGQWRYWLKNFWKECVKRNHKLDFIAIHWYDWGGWRKNGKTNLTDKELDVVVNDFKKHLNDCYAMYKLPIWITEFNVNPNRDTDTQIRFLKKALPMLEDHPYVERYAYYQPNSGTGKFVVAGEITEIGEVYASVVSKPVIISND